MKEPPGSQQPTADLVRGAQSGDPRAREVLFARYLPYVREIAALRMGWRLRQILEIDDLVQEVMLDAVQDLDRFEHLSEGGFRNWLARRIECKIIEAARSDRRRKRGGGKVRRFADYGSSILTSSIFGAETVTPSAHARGDELAERLEAAILELPDYQRELILLRAVCGMSFAEVAGELGISAEGTVRVAYSRALRKLERRLGL